MNVQTAPAALGSKAGLGSTPNRLIIGLLMCQMIHAPAWAQQIQTRALTIPHPLTSLLRSPSLYAELSAQPDQVEAMVRAVSQVDLPLWVLRDLSPQERHETAQGLLTQLKVRLDQILSTRQLERLNQIVWQALGVDAVLEPEVVARLNLSQEQVRNVNVFLDLAYEKLVGLQKSGAEQSERIRAVRLQKLHRETQDNVNAVLSPAQQQVWSRLQGRRFDFSQVRNIACRAPALIVDTWLNGAPVKSADLKGHVVVVLFYTFGCGNCIRTLPYVNAWHKRFSQDGLRIIGIHHPETEQERDIDKVRQKAAEAGMTYPIAIDNKGLNWNTWGNHVWPGIYLIDRQGFIRYWWYGELNWQGAESEALFRAKLRELLREPYEPVNNAAPK